MRTNGLVFFRVRCPTSVEGAVGRVGFCVFRGLSAGCRYNVSVACFNLKSEFNVLVIISVGTLIVLVKSRASSLCYGRF